jgi:hypothetical protein
MASASVKWGTPKHQNWYQLNGLLAGLIFVAFGLAACGPAQPATPTASLATPTSAPASPTTAPTAAVTPTDANNSAATATTQAQSTAIAQAVSLTVTAVVQSLATPTSRPATASPTANGAGAASPTASAGATPNASPVIPTASPTKTAAQACAIPPVRGFGLLYNAQPDVVQKIGCPTQPENATPTAWQPFEKGLLIWWGTARQIIVLQNDGNVWTAFADGPQGSQPAPTSTATPPVGRFAPGTPFAAVWSQHPELVNQLGWATAQVENHPDGALEEFAHGRMLWTPNQIIYVLYGDKTWQSFPDKFQS